MSDKLTLEEIDNIHEIEDGWEILKEINLDDIEGIKDIDDIKEILKLKYYPKPFEDLSNSRKIKLHRKFANVKSSLNDQFNKVKDIIRLPLFKAEFGEIYKISEKKIMEKQKKLEELISLKNFPNLTEGSIMLGEKTVKKISTIVKLEDDTNYISGKFEYSVDFLDIFKNLIDNPSIDESISLERMTINILNENSPVIIFLLDASNSNGLTKKVKEMIETARIELTADSNFVSMDDTNITERKNSSNVIDKAIFILNNWDVVRSKAKSKEEVEEVRRTIIQEIQKLWHESAVEGVQIFFLSLNQARQWLKKGLVQTELIKLRQSLTNLAVKLYERNFLDCLKLLKDILDYIEKQILLKINATVEHKYHCLYGKKNTENLCHQLEKIKLDSDKRCFHIIEAISKKLENMAKSLIEHFQSADVESRILNETKSKIKGEINMDSLTTILNTILQSQLYEELKIWEKDSNQIKQLDNYLNGLFVDHIYEISSQIDINNMLFNKETLICAWNSTSYIRMKKPNTEMVTKIERGFIVTTVALLFPVVAVFGLMAAPFIAHYMINKKKDSSENFKKYKSDPDAYLRELIKKRLEDLSTDDVRQSFFKILFDKCKDHIRSFDEFIRNELDEKRQLIKDINNEYRAMPEILESLNILLNETENCYGEYHLLKNSYQPDYTLMRRSTLYLRGDKNQVEIDEPVAISKNSTVFRCHRFSNTLFKMYNKRFSQRFARIQMQELKILALAPSQYILRLKHMCFLEKEKKLLLILENVDCNLHTYFNDNHDLSPLHQDFDSPEWKRAYHFIIDISKQLCNCLIYLHSLDRRMIHPDLRIETVLVSKTDDKYKVNILICDACTNLPTLRYIKKGHNSPEDEIEHTLDFGGYTKENIYRLGIIFYKMAYFKSEKSIEVTPPSRIKKIMEDIDPECYSVESLDIDIGIGWKEQKKNGLPLEYSDIIKKCISPHPQHRPDAKSCFEMLNALKF